MRSTYGLDTPHNLPIIAAAHESGFALCVVRRAERACLRLRDEQMYRGDRVSVAISDEFGPAPRQRSCRPPH